MKLVRKDDHSVEIVSTLERLVGTCGIAEACLGDDGRVELTYDGYTEVDWGSQETQVDEKGRRLFEDENGAILDEDEVELIEDEEDEEDEEA